MLKWFMKVKTPKRNLASVIFEVNPIASKQRLNSHVEVVHEGKNLKMGKINVILILLQ
jgi:hypothetical protein